MIEPTQPSGVSDAGIQQSQPRPRRRRLVVVGAAAAVVGLAGGISGGVAAIVSRSSTPERSNAASLFFPLAGAQPGNAAPGGGPAAMSAGAGAAQSATIGAPAAALATDAQGAMAPSYAMPGQNYPGTWCGGPSPAPAQGPGVTATGLAQVPLRGGAPVTTETLNAGVSSSGSDPDLKTALSDVQGRLNAVRDAIRKAGVPDDQISQQNINVWGNGNGGNGPKVANVQVNGGITATITDPAVADRAMRAAVDAGASNVNLYGSSGAVSSTPDTALVQSAITKATAEARSMAQTQAQAAGVALGALQATQVQPPSICPWQPGGPQMVVAVTLTYAIK
jgi:uncharacterized protein YggE